jgi:hypothetical protein
MKTKAITAFLALFVMIIAAPSLTYAHASEPSASGSYTLTLEDGLTKQVEFSATKDERGITTGEMTFRDEAGATDYDPDSGEDPPHGGPQLVVTARLDSLTIEHNRAVMGGTVTDSSYPGYIGKWVQLVVEDNGNGAETPDKVSWCFRQPEPGGWIPVDAEDPRDEGAYMHWLATDAELKDDVGVPSVNIIPGNSTGCLLFPLATYEFPEARGEGQIQVQP